MNNLDKTYTDLLQDILDNGVIKQDRTGTGTLSVFGRQIRHKMSDGFPLLTTKKMPFKIIVTELLWFLKGDTNIKYLVDNGCNVWNGDAYKNYLTVHSECVDGLESQEEFINKIKTDYSYSKWLDDNGYSKRAISLMWNQRSVDTFLGLPFNIASYGLLLEIIAKAVNMVPDELIGNLGDTHLYSNHIEQAKEQITREPFELPKLQINSGNENWHLLEIDEIINSLDTDITFKLKNYQSHSAIKAPLSN